MWQICEHTCYYTRYYYRKIWLYRTKKFPERIQNEKSCLQRPDFIILKTFLLPKNFQVLFRVLSLQRTVPSSGIVIYLIIVNFLRAWSWSAWGKSKTDVEFRKILLGSHQCSQQESPASFLYESRIFNRNLNGPRWAAIPLQRAHQPPNRRQSRQSIVALWRRAPRRESRSKLSSARLSSYNISQTHHAAKHRKQQRFIAKNWNTFEIIRNDFIFLN